MKKIIGSILAFIVIALFFALYKLPQEIHVTRSAVQYTENKPEATTQTSIKIDGNIYRSLFRKPTFKGSIVIDSIPFSKKDTMLDLVAFKENNNIYEATLAYQSNQTPYMISNQGLIWFDTNFEHMNIWASEKWLGLTDSSEHVYVVAPASNLDEAVNVQSRMRSSVGQDFLPK